MAVKDKPLDKESVKMLWLELGASETARRLGLPVGTVTGWACRYKWAKDRVLAHPRGHRVPVPVLGRSAPLSVASVKQTPAQALASSHKELASRARTALAQATVAAAEQAAAQEPLPVKSTAHLRDLAAGASALFGWADKNRQGDTYNTLIVTREQLAEIRQLREA